MRPAPSARGSSFWLSVYWAQALAAQGKDAGLKARFAPVAKQLSDNAEKIDRELIDCQGSPVDVGGYFRPEPAKAAAAMRPSATYNAIIDNL